MATVSLLTGFFLAALAGSADVGDAALLTQAEAAFHAGVQARAKPEEARPLFQRSAACYETLRQHGHDNADLDGNLGNARLLAGDLAGAILAYCEGLALAPNNRRLRTQLAYARRQVLRDPSGFDRPPDEEPFFWQEYLASAPLLYGCGLVYALGWLGMAAGWAVGRLRWILLGAAALGVAVTVGTGAWWAERSQQAERAHPVAVMARDGVYLRTGNGRSYPRRSDVPLHRGVEAGLLFSRGDWLQVELPSGEVGWVPRSEVLLSDP
jgi:hypothetical protein